MTAQTPSPVRTRPDGSTDIDHYTRRGRQARSDAFHQAIAGRAAGPARTGLVTACLALIGLPIMR